MKNADETIERVLAGLREVEAPEGMERRIVEAMRGACSGAARMEADGADDSAEPDWERRGLTTAVAGVVVLSLAAGWMVSRDHRIQAGERGGEGRH